MKQYETAKPHVSASYIFEQTKSILTDSGNVRHAGGSHCSQFSIRQNINLLMEAGALTLVGNLVNNANLDS